MDFNAPITPYDASVFPAEHLPLLLRGDALAWSDMLSEFTPFIHATVRRTLYKNTSRSSDDDDIQDVSQQVFERLLRNDYRLLRTFDPAKSSFPAWLALVAQSTTINFLLRPTLSTISFDDLPPSAEPEMPNPISEESHPEIPYHRLAPRQATLIRLLFQDDHTPLRPPESWGLADRPYILLRLRQSVLYAP